jgi:hypothetical protein
MACWKVDQNGSTAKDMITCESKLSDNGGNEASSPPQTDRQTERVWYLCTTMPLLTLLHAHVRGCNAVGGRCWRPELAPSDIHLLAAFCKVLQVNTDIRCEMRRWLSGLSLDFYCKRMNSLNSQTDSAFIGKMIMLKSIVQIRVCALIFLERHKRKLCHLSFRTSNLFSQHNVNIQPQPM